MSRTQWHETEEFTHAIARMLWFKEPLVLPQAELDIFSNVFLTRLQVIIRTLRSPWINHPHVKFLWCMWLHLSEEQQDLIRAIDEHKVVEKMTEQLICHAVVLEHMRNRVEHYWSIENYVTLIHNTTPKCMVRLDRHRWGEINLEYQLNPKFARVHNLAICYQDNAEELMTYIDDQRYSVLAESSDRLVLSTPKGNAQILLGQWVWFEGDELKHGGVKAFTEAQLRVQDRYSVMGYWFKPDGPKDLGFIPTTNLCPEVV